MRIAISLLLIAACGSSDRRPEEPGQAGTSETCAAFCKETNPLPADYTQCLAGCPGPSTTGDPTPPPDAGFE